MRFLHLSDLHLGKRVNEFSMLEEQRELLLEILRSIDEEQPQALLISGDIYDKPVPPPPPPVPPAACATGTDLSTCSAAGVETPGGVFARS